MPPLTLTRRQNPSTKFTNKESLLRIPSYTLPSPPSAPSSSSFSSKLPSRSTWPLPSPSSRSLPTSISSQTRSHPLSVRAPQLGLVIYNVHLSASSLELWCRIGSYRHLAVAPSAQELRQVARPVVPLHPHPRREYYQSYHCHVLGYTIWVTACCSKELGGSARPSSRCHENVERAF